MTSNAPRSQPASAARASPESGITLIEVMVAIMILGVALSALASTVIASSRSLLLSEARQEAYTLATRSIEVARSYPWENVATAEDDSLLAGVTRFDHRTGTIASPGSFEELVTDPDAAMVIGSEHQLGAASDPTRMRTYVTESGEEDLKRLTVVVEIERRGDLERVRQSTLISKAMWGAQQPSFSVSPVVAGRSLEPETEVCIPHRITNRGSTDTYQVIVPTAGTVAIEQVPALNQYESIRVKLHASGTTVLASGDFTPAVVFEEELDIRVCYTPKSSADPALATLPDLPIRLVSQINPDQEQVLLHTISVETNRTVQLRSFGPQLRDPSVVYPLADGEPLETVALGVLDGNHPDAGAGLLLPRGAIGAEARWTGSLNGTRTIRQAQLRLFTASSEVPVIDPPIQATGNYLIQLHHLDAEGNAIGSPISSQTMLHDESRTAFTQRDVTLDVTATTIAPSEQLGLSVRCESASSFDCRLAFSTVDHPADLQLTFRGPPQP